MTANKFSTFDELLNNSCFIPIGYRCYTTGPLKGLNLTGFTLPFNNGFFPPQSIASVLKTGNMDLLLDINKEPENFVFCKKLIPISDPKRPGSSLDGNSFQTITETEINEHIEKGYDNRFLDSDSGFYTLHKEHNYILAHYLWHKSSKKYTTNYRNIVPEISSMFQRRLIRLNEMCETHKNRFFVHYNRQAYGSVKINDVEYDLTDMSILKNQLNETFGENILLCFSNFKKKNKDGIYYFDSKDYDKFCKYAISKKEDGFSEKPPSIT